MKRMHSEEEIRAYLNQAEPITDAEVERFYERLKPKLLREIEKMPAKKPCRRKIGKISAIAAAILLKYRYPAAGQQVGQWISGAESRISQAVSGVIDRLSAGGGLTDAVEVFREAIQDPQIS